MELIRRASHDLDCIGRIKAILSGPDRAVDLAGRIQTSQLDLSSELSWSMDSYMVGFLTDTDSYGIQKPSKAVGREKETAAGSYKLDWAQERLWTDGFGVETVQPLI
ncbi:hypothetical protein Bca4012_009930 [Brassica carinata]